jgi:hypothetical protein
VVEKSGEDESARVCVTEIERERERERERGEGEENGTQLLIRMDTLVAARLRPRVGSDTATGARINAERDTITSGKEEEEEEEEEEDEEKGQRWSLLLGQQRLLAETRPCDCLRDT